MSALAGIILGWFLFSPPVAPEPMCPPLRSEVVRTYVPMEKYADWARANGKPVEYIVAPGGIITMVWMGTSTGAGIEVGTTTDLEAVEFNKRVRECQTLNGEFSEP